MNLSPAVIGAIKGVGIAVLAAVALYFSDAANLNGIVSPSLALVVAAIASSIESSMKAKSGNTTALFGTVNIR